MDNKKDAVYIPPSLTYTPKEYKPLDKKDIIFVLLYLLSSFLIVDFALFHGFHAGVFIAYLIFFVLTTVYISRKSDKLPFFSWACGALSVIGAFTFVLYDNQLIMLFMLVLVGALFGIYCMGISGGFGKNGGSYKMLIDVIISVFIKPFANIAEVFGSAKASARQRRKSFGTVIGFVAALPVLCIIIPLLVKSDAAFEGLVLGIIKNVGIYLAEVAIAVVLLVYLYPFAFGHRHDTNNSKGARKIKKCFPLSGCISFLGAISIVYAVYLFSQLAYFFSAFKGILPEDYSHSASSFARRGFYEMFAVCVINIIIVSVVSMFSKKKNLPVKLISTFISLFSVLLIVVAMEKMKLNISIFGLTMNRVLVSVFMLMVLFATLFFIIHIFVPKLSYIKPIILFCSILFIAMTYADMDMQIAKYNINAYDTKAVQSLDIENISDLSDSAVPYLVRLCSYEDDGISSSAKRSLTRKIIYDYNENLEVSDDYKTMTYQKNYDFRSFNYAEHKAHKTVMDYYNSLNEKEKEYFLTYYKYYNYGDYDEETDTFYYYGSGDDEYSVYCYDVKTGAYTIKSTDESFGKEEV